MPITWSVSQHKRLVELNATDEQLQMNFDDTAARNRSYQRIENSLAKWQQSLLDDYFNARRQPSLPAIERRLTDVLIAEGFVQVTTPILMSKGHLNRMTIDESHPLFSQIFWVGSDKCLRPMLAPHLYYLLKDLLRLREKPIRIFEIGPCFRKESQGRQHLNEFTMLNLVEMGLPRETSRQRLNQLTGIIMQTAGIDEFNLEKEASEVYGETIDVISSVNRIELGSAATGPHILDRAWKITETWVGIGFGVERLLMARCPGSHLAQFGRSLSYLEGIRLNV